jgi:hypothetical protein
MKKIVFAITSLILSFFATKALRINYTFYGNNGSGGLNEYGNFPKPMLGKY